MNAIRMCIIGLVALLIVGVCGCVNPNPQPQPIGPNATTNTTVTSTATTTATATPSVSPTASHTPTPATTISISGPSTIADGQGGVWIVYINGIVPTVSQGSQITWDGGGLGGAEHTVTTATLGPSSPYGSWVIDANGAALTAPGTYTLSATYQGASASYTVTRLANPVTPSPTPTPAPSPQLVSTGQYHTEGGAVYYGPLYPMTGDQTGCTPVTNGNGVWYSTCAP